MLHMLPLLCSLCIPLCCLGMEKDEPTVEPTWKQEFFALGEQLMRKNNIVINDPAERKTKLISLTLIYLTYRTSPKDYQSVLYKTVQQYPEWVALTDGESINPLSKLMRDQLIHNEFDSQKLLPWKAYVNHRTHPHNRSCLHELIWLQHAKTNPECLSKLIDFLMEMGIDPNLPCSPYENSALHLATQNGLSHAVEKLLTFKAININALNIEMRTPLDLAQWHVHSSLSTSQQMSACLIALERAGALTSVQVMQRQKNNLTLRKRCIGFINNNLEVMQPFLDQIRLPEEIANEIYLEPSRHS